jgi:predicted DNA-binding protein
MKTLAIRLEDEQHARLTMLAKLTGVTVTDAIRTAIEDYVTNLATNSELSARAESALADIEREASQRRDAIASLFSPTSANAGDDSAAAAPRRTTRTKR